MSEILAQLKQKGGGIGSVVEGHIFQKINSGLGTQNGFNSSGNVLRSVSADWTGEYIKYTESSGAITVLKPCKVTLYKNNDAPLTRNYLVGDIICYSNFNQVTLGSSIIVLVLG